MTSKFSPRSRVHIALLAIASTILTTAANADILELDWSDLVPQDGNVLTQAYDQLGVIQHDQISEAPTGTEDAPLTDAYNGKRVRIPGYVVPLEYLSTGVTTFILVPYVGACIHVPPPPPNQLILVSTDDPQTFSGLFEPVYVTGTLNTASASTELADIGYALTADTITPYQE